MTLAIGNATILGVLGLAALIVGAVVLQRARRVNDQIVSLASSMSDRRFVFKVDASTEATLPSRFNRGANAPPRPATRLPQALTTRTLADELEALDLPPGPASVSLAHRRKGEPTGPPAGPPPAPVADAVGATAPGAAPESPPDGVQEPLPLAYSPPRPEGVQPPTVAATPADTPAPAPPDAPGGPPADAEAPLFPVAGLSWRLPEAAPDAAAADSVPPAGPPDASSVAAAPEPAGPPAANEPDGPPSPGDGAPDFATLVREYIRALRWKVD